jgi:hypothetical protein
MQNAIHHYLRHDFPKRLAAARFKHPLRLQILVPGQRELRTYYELTSERVTWSEGLAEAGAQLTLAIQLPELSALAEGTLDVSEALTLGRIQVFGEETAARELGSLLSTDGLWEASR